MPSSQLEPLLRAADSGDGEARRQLFAALYDELHRMARRELKRSGRALTLGATTLLHDLYLAIHEREGMVFPDRARFLGYASRAMRGLVIDYARSRQTLKRGAGFEITSLPTDVPEVAADSSELEQLSEAIEQLALMDPRLAQVVDLKYFGGFSFADIAGMWQMSERTVQRDWEKARLLLHRLLQGGGAAPASQCRDPEAVADYQ